MLSDAQHQYPTLSLLFSAWLNVILCGINLEDSGSNYDHLFEGHDIAEHRKVGTLFLWCWVNFRCIRTGPFLPCHVRRLAVWYPMDYYMQLVKSLSNILACANVPMGSSYTRTGQCNINMSQYVTRFPRSRSNLQGQGSQGQNDISTHLPLIGSLQTKTGQCSSNTLATRLFHDSHAHLPLMGSPHIQNIDLVEYIFQSAH